MSEPKWTEGEWLLATSNSWRRFVNQAGESVCEPCTQRDGHPDLHFGIPGNADLIVAAPKLYSSLEKLLAKLALIEEALSSLYVMAEIHGVGYSGPNYVQEREEAIAALAKARGEAE